MNFDKDKFLKTIDNSKYTVIVGLSKNAGKTSFLNWLLKQYQKERVGIFTTGREGEDSDLVFGHEKPKAFIPSESIFTSFAKQIDQNSPFLRVISKTDYKAGGKEIWLASNSIDFPAEIIGPSTVNNQIKLADSMLDYGAEHVFIDGSLDRKTIALSTKIRDIIIVVSPLVGNEKAIFRKTYYYSKLAEIPIDKGKISSKNIIESIYSHETEISHRLKTTKSDYVLFKGALSAISFDKLKPAFRKYSGKIIFQHPLNLRLSELDLNWLSRHTNLRVRHNFNILAFVVNSFSSDGNHLDCEILRSYLRAKIVKIPIIDIKELEFQKKR